MGCTEEEDAADTAGKILVASVGRHMKKLL